MPRVGSVEWFDKVKWFGRGVWYTSKDVLSIDAAAYNGPVPSSYPERGDVHWTDLSISDFWGKVVRIL